MSGWFQWWTNINNHFYTVQLQYVWIKKGTQSLHLQKCKFGTVLVQKVFDHPHCLSSVDAFVSKPAPMEINRN